MALRYTPEELIYFKESPLAVKPPALPPVEQWMGASVESTGRATKPANDRAKNYDSNNLEQTSRRPGADRHISRNSANPEDIILGPPKTSFMSATSIRNPGKPFDPPDRPTLRDADSRDRFNFRGKLGEGDIERLRGGRNDTLRPKRADGEDSDGWTPVKPRKSFGTEGAERFNGRMGVAHRDDRRFKDREERDGKDRPRGFEMFTRDKDVEYDQERENRRNGTGRGRNEPSWFRDKDDVPTPPKDRNSNGDRLVDRTRGWREKIDRDDKERMGDRGDRGDRERGDRGDRGDRRWDRERDQRQEREPEWMDEPADEQPKQHSQADFQKWKEERKRGDVGKTPLDEPVFKPDAGASFFGLEKQKVETPLEIESGPDKFFGMWSTPKEEIAAESSSEPKIDGPPKAKTVGKASRFTSFFAPQEEAQRRVTEPPPANPPPPQNGLDALFANNSSSSSNAHASSASEQAAFQQLLQKLHRQTAPTGTTPPANLSLQPKPPAEKPQHNPVPAPEPYQQYRPERQEDIRPTASSRNSQQALQDLLHQRSVAGSQPAVRPEQMLQELVGQRQNAMSQSSVRPDQPPSRNTNTEFLMGLMQSAKAAPEPQRSEQVLLRMPPKSTDRQMQQMMEREREEQMMREMVTRERSASQRQARPQAPPGFYDDPVVFQRGPPQHERPSGNPPQPTQILQRPPPPGLDMGWDRQAQLPPQHRMPQNIAPPPGLAGGPNRGMPMPQQMFPPGFMGGMPMPQQMPPPGFFNAPPPGFLPPGMNGYQGPDALAFGAPFDGRGPPPQGAFRRQ